MLKLLKFQFFEDKSSTLPLYDFLVWVSLLPQLSLDRKKSLQSNQVKHTPQEYILFNEMIIGILNPLVVPRMANGFKCSKNQFNIWFLRWLAGSIFK